jgi:phosphoribosylformylglycinamidine synthase
MVMAAELGLELDLAGAAGVDALAPDVVLFGESLARLVVSVAPDAAAAFEADLAGTACRRIGRVTEPARLRVSRASERWLDVEAGALRVAFQRTLGGAS